MHNIIVYNNIILYHIRNVAYIRHDEYACNPIPPMQYAKKRDPKLTRSKSPKSPGAPGASLTGLTFSGVVQAAKNAWLKSGVNLVRSLRYIKDFEEGRADDFAGAWAGHGSEWPGLGWIPV